MKKVKIFSSTPSAVEYDTFPKVAQPEIPAQKQPPFSTLSTKAANEYLHKSYEHSKQGNLFLAEHQKTYNHRLLK